MLTAALLVSTLAVAAEEPSEQVKRMDAAANVLDEIMGTPDKGIPEELLDSAKCLAVIPSMVKIGFVFGGRHGRGIATCRTTSGWSAPAPFTVTGGSWGLQIGGEAVDVVMLVMNDRGMEKMLSSKFKIGADASAAAGPVGRHVEGTTDWKMRAEVLTYLLGDNFSFTDDSEVLFEIPERNFSSFRQAAKEAGISRLYGGIHYRDAVENGQEQGRRLAEKIIGQFQKAGIKNLVAKK